MQPNGCISTRSWQVSDCYFATAQPRLNARPDSVLQIERAGPEIDDPVVTLQNLGSEQAHRGRRSFRRFVQNTVQVDNPHVFAGDVEQSERKFLDPRKIESLSFDINRRGLQGRPPGRNVQSLHTGQV